MKNFEAGARARGHGLATVRRQDGERDLPDRPYRTDARPRHAPAGAVRRAAPYHGHRRRPVAWASPGTVGALAPGRISSAKHR